MDKCKQFLGKYRATVTNNIDPLKRGRVEVSVPDVSNLIPSTWAMPCLPFAGTQSGMIVIPAIGAGVWVEFEQGDLDYPIWVGGYWGESAELPVDAIASSAALQTMVIQTSGQYTIVVSDVPGQGITLKGPGGLSSIILNEQGIFINNGRGASITLKENIVAINGTALTIA